MRMSNKVVLGLLAGAVLLCFGAGTAAALNSIGASATAITGAAANVTFLGTFGQVICNVTLQGTLASRISKVSGSTAGKVTAGSVGGCSSGGATILIGSGWALEYRLFGGVLPNIGLVNFTSVGTSFQIQLGALCTGLYRANITLMFNAPDTSTSYTRIHANSSVGNHTLARVMQLAGSCPTTITISGAWTLTPTVTVTLH